MEGSSHFRSEEPPIEIPVPPGAHEKAVAVGFEQHNEIPPSDIFPPLTDIDHDIVIPPVDDVLADDDDVRTVYYGPEATDADEVPADAVETRRLGSRRRHDTIRILANEQGHYTGPVALDNTQEMRAITDDDIARIQQTKPRTRKRRSVWSTIRNLLKRAA